MEARNSCGSVISVVEVSTEQTLSGCSSSLRCANSGTGLIVIF